MGDLTETDRARAALAGVARPRRARRTPRHRGPAARAAPRRARGRPLRRRRPRRRRRRAPVGQEHAAAHGRRQRRPDHDAAGVAVLRPRLRRRHVRADGRRAARRRASATRSEPDVVRRAFAEVTGIVDRREKYFRQQGIDSIETYRQRRAEGTADDGYGDVFLVVDGWSTLRSDFDDLEMQIQVAGPARPHLRPARRHRRQPLGRLPRRDPRPVRQPVRAAARRPARLRDRPQGRPAGAQRSARSRHRAALGQQAALPRRPAPDRRRPPTRGSVGRGVEDFVERTRKAWTGTPGPKLRLLPERVQLADVLAQAERRDGLGDGRVYLAIDEKDLAPVGLDVDREPHLLRLRRHPLGQERGAAHLPPRGDAHPHGRRGPGVHRRLPPLAARRGARGVPGRVPHQRPPGRAGRSGSSRRTSRRGCPAPTSRRSSCGTGRGGPAPRCSSSSTTTTSW